MIDLMAKIEEKKATVGIIGLGYVGFPLLIRFGEAGFPLIGFDIDSRKINALKAAQSYIKHIPMDKINNFLSAGQLDVTLDFEQLREADGIIICVPTPLTETLEPDLRFVVHTAEEEGYRRRTGISVLRRDGHSQVLLAGYPKPQDP